MVSQSIWSPVQKVVEVQLVSRSLSRELVSRGVLCLSVRLALRRVAYLGKSVWRGRKARWVLESSPGTRMGRLGGPARPWALLHAHDPNLDFCSVISSCTSLTVFLVSLSPDLPGFPLGRPWPLCPATELHEYVCQLVWLHAADPLSDEARPRPL